MKHLLFRVLFFVPLFLAHANPDEFTKRHFIQLTNQDIKHFDGYPYLMDAKTIHDCVRSRGHTRKLLYGKYDKITKTYTKSHNLHGQPVALNDLVILERQYNEQEIDDNHPLRRDLEACLLLMKDQFKEIQEPLLKKASNPLSKKTNQALIHEWCQKANRNNSLLLHWGKGNEFDALYKASATEFRQFCLDLVHFLHDLMYSCPKARLLYKEAYIDVSQWELFEKEFEQR